MFTENQEETNMRFYDYKCPDCKSIKEYHESTDSDSEKHLCECGSEMKRAVTSAPAFKFVNKPIDIKHSERRKKWNSNNSADKI